MRKLSDIASGFTVTSTREGMDGKSTSASCNVEDPKNIPVVAATLANLLSPEYAKQLADEVLSAAGLKLNG